MLGRGRPPKGVERHTMTLRIPTPLLERIKAHQARLEELAGVSIARHDGLLPIGVLDIPDVIR